MNDLISRQAAIDEVKEIYKWHDNVTKERIIEHFKQLSPAQQQWIPCSERLPEMDDRVLVYTTGHEYHLWDAMPNRGENYAWEDEEGLYHNLYEADLWLPLPEPYAERRTDDLQ